MGLTVLATPIGNKDDISLAGVECLRNADIVIGEERAEASRLLKFLGISAKPIEQLNEHSRPDDIVFLTQLCKEKNVVLVSDCGTPGFCDPGHQLVAACRLQNIAIKTRPGASSIMGILSLSSQRIDQFLFQGFLPADREERGRKLASLSKETQAMILMETPYRLKKWLEDINQYFPKRRALLALNLTQDSEWVAEGTLTELLNKLPLEKAEPILLLYAAPTNPAKATWPKKR